VDWLRTHPPFIIDYEQLRSGFKFKPTYARKIIQRMVRKGLIKRITYGIFELTEKPLIPQVREAERHILSTVGDVVGGPPHVNGLQLTTALGRRGSKAFDRIRASLSKPSRSPIDWRLHRCKNTLYLQKKDIKFPGGWFTLRLFRSGTLNVYVTAKRSGLDSRGLIDLLNRIAVEVHTFSGRYVYAEDLKLRGPTEENFDTQDPRFRKMLEVQDVKSIKTYSTLLHCYLRIYDKCGRVRVETGGYPANASLLARTLCTPVSAIENLATLPVLLDALEDRLAAKWQVLQAGMSQVLQQVEEVKQQIKEASESRA
jgi:hypothetical protein